MNAAEYQENLQEIETDFGRFTYLDIGQGPPALFVHGLFVSSYLWHGVLSELKEERRCIAYNLPDHGGSVVADDQDLALPAQAEILAAFCRALGLERFDLVGNDTGGGIC